MAGEPSHGRLVIGLWNASRAGRLTCPSSARSTDFQADQQPVALLTKLPKLRNAPNLPARCARA